MNVLKLSASVAGVMLLVGCGAQSTTVCTDAPMSEWLDQTAFQQQLLSDGYQISEFKVTDGQCYEIYGFNPAGEKVEIYFNPVDGSVVKEEKE
ncbi:PepSY domain-containing protein [Pseudidiomarina taiwanensis]|uniref:PepSY domain-containing protein n=1 Tax=Pseudidiomarina taiwanensis TaxID=337250 RepID=A0A432ZKB3_9GAMM|nr:PepSY domain-containing protein [Pseudidiomarina taiwanensis]RUO78379.1 PepSY domain-containing protein [Pseudidiomarina taiwanensis]